MNLCCNSLLHVWLIWSNRLLHFLLKHYLGAIKHVSVTTFLVWLQVEVLQYLIYCSSVDLWTKLKLSVLCLNTLLKASLFLFPCYLVPLSTLSFTPIALTRHLIHLKRSVSCRYLLHSLCLYGSLYLLTLSAPPSHFVHQPDNSHCDGCSLSRHGAHWRSL